jgi:SAM-dependent methyltransferase
VDDDPIFRPDLYRGTARYYDRFRLPYPAPLLDDLRSRAGLTGDGRLLDLACGTGHVTFALSADFREIVAFDQEPESVAWGRAKAEALGYTHTEWVVGTAEEVAVAGPFDMVAIGNAFHRVRRQRIAERSLGWLSPGGHLALLWGGTPFDGVSDWQQVLQTIMADWRDRLGEERVPAGWEEAMARDPNDHILSRVGFRYEGSRDYAIPHIWTLETLIGFLYSTSILSRHALGGRAGSFEDELSERMLECRPDGKFDQSVHFSYQLARKAV